MPLQATSGAASQDAFGGGSAAGGVANYIEEVFSTYLYTGNGGAQTITNGIDLAGKGGLVWEKDRNNANGHHLWDTVRGAFYLESQTTAAQAASSGFTFNSNGFTIPAPFGNVDTHASWTFREQAKFFDVVTYTGNGTAGRQIAHSLGSTPGCIMIKVTSTTGNWVVLHRSTSTAYQRPLQLNTTAAEGTLNTDFAATSTTFSVSNGSTNNANGDTYVAYLFAHDAGGFGLTGTDNVISCGSFTTDGSGNATVTLGYEPQWLLTKSTDLVDQWYLLDSMRGWPVATASTKILAPNTSDAESTGTLGNPTATGFTFANGGATKTYIYIAIRRGPMKVPTTGTSVYENTAYTGNNTAERKIGSSVLTDLLLLSNRDATAAEWSVYAQYVFDRLRGQNLSLATASTAIQGGGWTTYFNLDMNTGWDTGSTTDQQYLNKTSATYVSNAFRRAPSFMDVVCYTGTGSARTINHNLGVAPELYIVKGRSSVTGWSVGSTQLTALQNLLLNANDAVDSGASTWNSTYPTASVFSVGTSGQVNGSGTTYVAYLFATCAGVSKVGSYTGTGALQTVNCGFTSGARFILIKRTDSTGDWWMYDSARGISSGNDPYLFINSTAAEVTSTNYVDTDSTGFKVTAAAPAGLNASGGTYIFLAIA